MWIWGLELTERWSDKVLIKNKKEKVALKVDNPDHNTPCQSVNGARSGAKVKKDGAFIFGAPAWVDKRCPLMLLLYKACKVFSNILNPFCPAHYFVVRSCWTGSTEMSCCPPRLLYTLVVAWKIDSVHCSWYTKYKTKRIQTKHSLKQPALQPCWLWRHPKTDAVTHYFFKSFNCHFYVPSSIIWTFIKCR